VLAALTRLLLAAAALVHQLQLLAQEVPLVETLYFLQLLLLAAAAAAVTQEQVQTKEPVEQAVLVVVVELTVLQPEVPALRGKATTEEVLLLPKVVVAAGALVQQVRPIMEQMEEMEEMELLVLFRVLQ
jgi:hypothetical protein